MQCAKGFVQFLPYSPHRKQDETCSINTVDDQLTPELIGLYQVDGRRGGMRK